MNETQRLGEMVAVHWAKQNCIVEEDGTVKIQLPSGSNIVVGKFDPDSGKIEQFEIGIIQPAA